MKKLTLILLVFCAFTIKAQVNLVKNGSFELNTVIPGSDSLYTSSNYNNNIMFSIHFGDYYTTTLVKIPYLACQPPILWGGGGKRWRLGTQFIWAT